ncbi:MAG: cyclic nucleotide-binding domain-containing protein [Spirochaetaceae bacterium]|jgi:CRP-like cAMP-binding protein|nr:cyclic nucleotide-binding domain-containing protein [Spirochaetaceae bacterium]
MAEKPQLSIVSYAQGAYITIEGQNINKFFILQRGSVSVSNPFSSRFEKDNKLQLSPGDFVGVLSAMSGRPQVETSRADTETQLIAVNTSQFEGLIQHNTSVALKILQQFSRQVRTLNNALTQITINSKNNEEDNEILYQNAQYYAAKRDFAKAYYCYKRYVECYPSAKNAQKAVAEMKKMHQFDKPGYVEQSNFVRRYNTGSLFCSEGESGGEMYILQSGRANITKIVNGTEATLAVLNAGDMFGEMSLLEEKPRSASAAAMEECVVMVVTKNNFMSMTAAKPQLITRLTKMLAERIWYSCRLLSTVRIEDTETRFFSMLCLLIEKERVETKSSYSFSFNLGIEEIMNMASIPQTELRRIKNAIGTHSVLKITDGKLFTTNAGEIIKITDQYKRQASRHAS